MTCPNHGACEESIDVIRELKWVYLIARNVANRYFLRSETDLEDIVSSGTVAMLTALQVFEPPSVLSSDISEAFKGYAHRAVLTACQREAERILNGGTYKTRRRQSGRDPVIVHSFSEYEMTDDDQEFEPASDAHAYRFRHHP